ncbi:MAG: TetR/AcrR family transcriptional regulator [Conexibacter sp.]
MDRGLSPTRDGDDGAAQRRRLPASERRRVILEAALHTFATRGYDGTAMDEIAAAAGVSKAVVYDHVASKRELYTVLLDSICSDLVGVVETALAPALSQGEGRVRRGTDAFFRYVEEHPAASRLLILELRGAIVSPIGRELEERIAVALASTLGDDVGLFGGHADRERQLRILAELLKSAIQGLADWWLRNPATPRADLVERSVGVLWPAIERARP